MEFQPIATVIAALIGAGATLGPAIWGARKYFIMKYAGSEIITRYEKSSAYMSDLISFVLDQDTLKQTIYISVGAADNCVPFLQRVFDDRNKNPRIDNIHIKRISSRLTTLLITNDLLEKDFLTLLECRIASLKADRNIRNAGVNITISEWDGLPTFQGYLFNEQGFTSHWQVNGQGHLDARTPLERYSKYTSSDRFRREMRAFGLDP